MFLLKAYDPERFRERLEQTNLLDIHPDKLTPAQLDKIAEHLLKQALGDNPPVVAEAKRRIEAGESVTVEAMYEFAAQESAGVSRFAWASRRAIGRLGAMSARVVLERDNIPSSPRA